MSLSDSLTNIQQSTRSIDSRTFNRPRMFTNAMVNAPEITTLIKDPTYDESLLYTITNNALPSTGTSLSGRSKLIDDLVRGASMDTKSERIDGRVIYTVEPIVSDKPQEDPMYNDDDDAAEGYVDRRTPIVKFPNLDVSAVSSRSLINLNSSSDLGQVFYQTSQVLDKYPNLIEEHGSLVGQLRSFERDYRGLEKEILELEDEIKERKSYLGAGVDASYTAAMPSDAADDEGEEDDGDIDIDEIIRHEREEIEQLELRLKQFYNK
ncbi:hypothetical protein Cantr_02323 [Candida viswanathii]|uniref:DASH complex subunit SPC34 n=1 Tax=Candida viswanathii TaxID=5486 RepID=A0A367YR48_9ASCO|nr:hypothetical protein Cantr_02323 [Candida viswanathii]